MFSFWRRNALIRGNLVLFFGVPFIGSGNICSYLKHKRKERERRRRHSTVNLCSVKWSQQLPLPWILRAFLCRMHFERRVCYDGGIRFCWRSTWKWKFRGKTFHIASFVFFTVSIVKITKKDLTQGMRSLAQRTRFPQRQGNIHP